VLVPPIDFRTLEVVKSYIEDQKGA
jgi:hypothetical protein